MPIKKECLYFVSLFILSEALAVVFTNIVSVKVKVTTKWINYLLS